MASLFESLGQNLSTKIIILSCGMILIFLLNEFGALDNLSVRSTYWGMRRSAHTRTYSSKSDACGTWQQSYMDLHRSILSGSQPPRYLVVVTAERGFTDRVTAALTGFMFALLSNRAYQIITYGTLPRFEAAFSTPNINWSRPTDPDKLIDNLKYTYRGVRGYSGDRSYGPEVNTSKYWPIYLIDDHEGNNNLFVNQNLSAYPINRSNVETVFFASNLGRIVRLFDNQYHRASLFKMGLRPETTPRCLWNFLFKPKEAIKLRMAEEFQILDSPDTLKIAIHIRVGDHVFDPERDKQTTLETFQHYFQCASDIESFARVSNQKIIWYVTSDSFQLRKLAKARYPDKVFTQDKNRPIHGDCGDSAIKSVDNCTKSSQDTSIVDAAGHMLAISMCDFVISGTNTGFGSFASWLRGPWHNVYRLGTTPKACTQNSYESLETLAALQSGV